MADIRWQMSDLKNKSDICHPTSKNSNMTIEQIKILRDRVVVLRRFL
jgi:hypothetical protein